MRPPPAFFILRHGETEWNVQGRIQGALDSPLTPKGVEQARRQNAILKTLDLTGYDFITSPQGRAVQTAEIAFDGLCKAYKTDDRLREITMGDWTGQQRQKLGMGGNAAKIIYDFYNTAPNGEHFAGLKARCASFLNNLETPCVIVTHGITSRMLRLLALGKPVTQIMDLAGGQGVVYKVDDGVHKKVSLEASL